ncbi:MAG TPA: hypothetical protein VNF45_06525 [Candidatus Binataceae bacterium]|nr:hypothetical protein [Candidatus Binataceae bacterium]
MADCEIFELGDVALPSGITLRQAKLAYKTYGKLAARRLKLAEPVVQE